MENTKRIHREYFNQENPFKRRKTNIIQRPINTKNICVMLKPNNLLVILNFLDTSTVFGTIAGINTFFYHFIQNNKKNFSYFTLAFTLTNNTTDFHNQHHKILIDLLKNCHQLEKLQLKVHNSGLIKKLILQPTNKIFQDLSKMPLCTNLRVFELKLDSYDFTLIKTILNSLISLESLSLKLGFSFPYGISYIVTRFIDPNGLPCKKQSESDHPKTALPFTPLKKLSLEYATNYHTPSEYSKFFKVIDKSKVLEELTLKTCMQSLSNLFFKPRAFVQNSTLRVLKISSNLIFDEHSSEKFCNFLKHPSNLEILCIHHSICTKIELFEEVISNNRKLKKLKLLNSMIKNNQVLEIEKLRRVLNSIKSTNIINFSATSTEFVLENENFQAADYNEQFPEYYKAEKCRGFLETLDSLLINSKSLKKLRVGIEEMPEKYIEIVSMLIIESVKSYTLEIFNGINLKHIIEGKISKEQLSLKISQKKSGYLNSTGLILKKILNILEVKS